MNKHKFLLEICVDSLPSALAAVQGGADRLELCSDLLIGGTTPDLSLFEQVRRSCPIPIHVLIRPRAGHFFYSDAEFEQIKDQVRRFRSAGADGLVIGLLTPERWLDLLRLQTLTSQTSACHLTLHRAFDWVIDPQTALEQAISLGFDTILTSGQQATAFEGLDLLCMLIRQAAGRIDIMAGGGVNDQNIPQIHLQSGIRTYHLSGKIRLPSHLSDHQSLIQFGRDSTEDLELWQTSVEKVRDCRRVLDKLLENFDA
ncbi:MAG: copper homeostasis protein CutC [Eubacteriales bacterium]|nr:copper homeostasis protein CutC [Eubacteriales bacterium]